MSGIWNGTGKGAGAAGGRGLRPVQVLCLLVALAVVPACGRAQQTGTTNPFPTPHGFPPQDGPLGSIDGSNPFGSERRLREINAERQKALVADTNKLLRLATELNAEIAKSNPGALTPEQIRKVAEIEKLAHSVRDKMAMSLRGPMMNIGSPPFLQPIP